VKSEKHEQHVMRRADKQSFVHAAHGREHTIENKQQLLQVSFRISSGRERDAGRRDNLVLYNYGEMLFLLLGKANMKYTTQHFPSGNTFFSRHKTFC
jgi:hypothetical protein